MRDITDYEDKYITEPCEKYQVAYRRKKVLELMSRYSHENILEIGCGLEPIFMFTDEWKTMTIVEPGEKFAENARNEAVACKRKVDVICDFFENSVSTINNQKYDYIIISSLLHELEHPEELLSAVYECASKETVIHINVPNAKSLHRLLAKEMGLIKDEHELSDLQKRMQRNWVFDIDSLCSFLDENGFEVIEKGSYFPKFLTASMMEKMLSENIINENIFSGLYELGKYLPEFGSEIFVQARKK